MKIVVFSFLVGFIFSALAYGVMSVMVSAKSTSSRVRKFWVKLYKILYGIGTLGILVSIVMLLVVLLKTIYKSVYEFSFFVSENQIFAGYITLSFILIFSVPLIKLLIKFIKRNNYIKDKKGKGAFSDMDDSGCMQSLMYVMSNTIIDVVNKIPYVGFIHIANLLLVIASNVMNTFNTTTNVKNTSIYMAVATFYAVDRVCAYFKKEYAKIWKKMDNKIFLTEEIDREINFDFKTMRAIIKEMFANYISLGKCELSEDAKALLKQKKNF